MLFTIAKIHLKLLCVVILDCLMQYCHHGENRWIEIAGDTSLVPRLHPSC